MKKVIKRLKKVIITGILLVLILFAYFLPLNFLLDETSFYNSAYITEKGERA